MTETPAPRQPAEQDPAAGRTDAEMRRLRAVRDVARALGSTLDLDRLLDLILNETTEVMDADRSTLYLLTDDGSGLWSRITQGEGRIKISLKLGEGVAGWVAQEGRSLRIEDAYSDPRFHRLVDQASGYRTRSILCSPLKDSGGRIMGVIQVLNRRGGPFSGDDQALLEVLAGQAAISLENSRLYQAALRQHEELRRTHSALTERVAELDLLYLVEREMNESPGLDRLLERLLEHAMERIGTEAGTVLLRDRPGSPLHFRATGGPLAGRLRHVRLAPGEGIAGWVAAQGEPVLTNDPDSDPRFHRRLAAELGFTPRNILCVPLATDEGILGAFQLLSKRSGGFDDDDLRLLGLIAGRASRAIQLSRAREAHLRESHLASIGQMLSGLLHDFKTPMTVISGYAQLMAGSESAGDRDAHAAVMLKQLDLMSTMIREVLAFARGESRLLLRRVPLTSFLREVEEQLGPQLKARGIELVIEPGERGFAVFDESKLLRVIHNLARNAAEAMPTGGTFRVAVSRETTALTWRFVDTGCGIPPEVEGHLFEAFATSGKDHGTGLGLAIVKKIIEEHDGTIEYATAAGQGTTFTIRIPSRETEERPAEGG